MDSEMRLLASKARDVSAGVGSVVVNLHTMAGAAECR